MLYFYFPIFLVPVSYQFITSATQLNAQLHPTNAVLAQILQQRSIAIDFEFYRRFSYRSQLCLILLSNEAGTVLIDALAETLQKPIQALLKRLAQQHQLIFYSASQDLEIFDDVCHYLPEQCLDLQHAGIFYCQHPQPSQVKLAQKLLQTSKTSAEQTSDWRKRPLSQKQIDYAVSDINSIWQIYQILQQRLSPSQWQAVQEDSAHSIRQQRYSKDYHHQCQITGKRLGFNPTQVQLLQQLTQWQQQQAQQLNLPSNWIIDKTSLLKLCVQPENSQQIRIGFDTKLHRFRRQPNASKRQRLQQSLDTLLRPYQLAQKPADWQQQLKPYRLSPLLPEQQQQLAQLQQQIHYIAHKNAIAVEHIAGRESLIQYLLNPQKPQPLTHGWRKYLLARHN